MTKRTCSEQLKPLCWEPFSDLPRKGFVAQTPFMSFIIEESHSVDGKLSLFLAVDAGWRSAWNDPEEFSTLEEAKKEAWAMWCRSVRRCFK